MDHVSRMLACMCERDCIMLNRAMNSATKQARTFLVGFAFPRVASLRGCIGATLRYSAVVVEPQWASELASARSGSTTKQLKTKAYATSCIVADYDVSMARGNDPSWIC